MLGENPDVVALWEVSLPDGIHVIDFEHETTSGRRVIRVDSEEIIRKDWMFKLVGQEAFSFGSKSKPHRGVIRIDPMGGFAYQYSLVIDGKPYKTFLDQQSKIMKTWILPVDGEMCRVVLEKDTLDIWVNGKKVEVAAEFTDDGTETHFNIGKQAAYILNVSSGNRRIGIIHKLLIDDNEVPEYVE